MKKRDTKRNTRRLGAQEIHDLKALLGPMAEDFTDAELVAVHRKVHALMGVLVDIRKRQEQGSQDTIQY